MKPTGKSIGIYVRVSSKRQDLESQVRDLEKWAGIQDSPVRWYKEKASGLSMDRPEWLRLERDYQDGEIGEIVVWRVDRLGRTAAGLTKLFKDLRGRKVNLRSLKDSLDLSTPAGRLMANVLASVSEYEGEIRRERILAGQAAARAAGKTIGGSVKGQRRRATREKEATIRTLLGEGKPIAEIARIVGVSRPLIYSIKAETA